MNIDQSLLFDIVFFALMIAPVAPIATWYRNRLLSRVGPDARERILSTLRRDTRRMWIAWAAALFLVIAWLGIDPNGAILPGNFAVIIGFHVLFWPFVFPVVNKVERLVSENERGGNTQPSVRTASLNPRRLNGFLPQYAALLAVVIVLSGLFVAFAALMQIGEIEARFVIIAVALTAFGVFELLVLAFFMRFEVETAAPYAGLTPAAAEELRRFRVSGFFWMLVATSVLSFACALGCIEVGHGTIPEPNLGIIGGIAGSLVGLAGAAFGIAASLKANRLRQESNAAKP